MNLQLDNTDIWQCGEELYVKRSDGNIVRIQGSSTGPLAQLLTHLRSHTDVDGFPSETVSREQTARLLRFLLDNGLVRDEKPATATVRKLGFFGGQDVLDHLSRHLRCAGTQLQFQAVKSPADLGGLQLLLIASPVFDQASLLADLGDEAYRRQIPALYTEYSPTTFTLGPLAVPWMDTPSIHCYLKRKSVNLSHPQLYSEFIQSQDKVRINEAVVSRYPYFGIGVQLTQAELEKFWQFKGRLSTHLMGRSVTYDFLQHRVEHSRVLKDPMSPLFRHTPFTPFNG